MKNQLFKMLTRPYQRFRNQGKEIKRFLVVSTTGLGDTLWGTPAIRAIKETNPGCKLGVVTSPIGMQILGNNPHIDTLIQMKSASPFQWRLVREIQQFNPDCIFVFHTSQRSALPLCSMNRAHTIIGTKGLQKGLDDLLTHVKPEKFEHEITRRLKIVEEVGIMATDETLDWFISNTEKLWAQGYAKQFDHPIIALHPGSKDRFKQWPLSHFAQVGRLCQDELGVQIVVTGNHSEQGLAENLASMIPGAVSLAGKMNIRQLGAFLPHVRCFVTNDTGPMHMAFANKTPTVALFVPTDPKRCGPHHAQDVCVIAKEKTCRPCLRKKCSDAFCMRSIGVDDVFAILRRLDVGKESTRQPLRMQGRRRP